MKIQTIPLKVLMSVGVSLLVAACTAPPAAGPASGSAPAAGSAAAVTGVQADTDEGRVALSAFYYGRATELPVGTVPSTVPQVGELKEFIVNVPGATASDAAVYWVSGLTHIWAENQVSIHSETRSLDGGAFALTTPNLADRTGGFAMLVLNNIEGGPPRFYAVALGK